MKYILIADAGSTTVDWVKITENAEVEASHISEGINALLGAQDAISHTLEEVAAAIPNPEDIAEVYFYGAGCATPQICKKMQDALSKIWRNADINVESDLLGAARALFGNRKGIACILGTGSNSCLYDGKKIISQIPSLGYVLGDEGSGAALGKRLVSDAFKLQIPDSLRDKFLQKYSLSLPGILNKTYSEPAPNKFLASLVPFLSENLLNPYIYSLVLEEFTSFIKRNVAMYRNAHTIELSFIGSIAHQFEKILREAAASQGYSVSNICKSPIEGLIKYHSDASLR